MKEHTFSTPKTVSYATLGELTSATAEIWIACHGYGQLVRYFIQKFENLDNGNRFIIAPEGLSHFYLEGFTGRVGASWMTSNQRSLDIRDQITYLNSLTESLIPADYAGRIIAFGFSQGAAAITRWIVQSKFHIDHLFISGGMIPHELLFPKDEYTNPLQQCDIAIAVGDSDPLISDRHRQDLEKLKNTLPRLETIVFEGKHEVSPDVLEQMANRVL